MGKEVMYKIKISNEPVCSASMESDPESIGRSPYLELRQIGTNRSYGTFLYSTYLSDINCIRLQDELNEFLQEIPSKNIDYEKRALYIHNYHSYFEGECTIKLVSHFKGTQKDIGEIKVKSSESETVEKLMRLINNFLRGENVVI